MACRDNEECPMCLTEDKSWTRGEFDYARDPCDEFRAQCFNIMWKSVMGSNEREQREDYGKSDYQKEAIPEVSINDVCDEYSITSLELQLPILMMTNNCMRKPDKSRYVWDWLEDNEYYFNSNKLTNCNERKEKNSQNQSDCKNTKVNGSINEDLNDKCGNKPHVKTEYCNQ